MAKKSTSAKKSSKKKTDTEVKHPTVPEAPAGSERKVRLRHLKQMKKAGRPIVMTTAYDACFAQLADRSNADMILVGDSLGMVVYGHENTLNVTMDMMVRHTAAVSKASNRAFIIADMPFMSFQVSIEEAIRNAGRLIAEGGAEAVKIEGFGQRTMDVIQAIVDCGIPVMGHVGLVPQSLHALSGFRVQGKNPSDADRIELLATAQEKSGVFAMVLENVPEELGAKISKKVSVPVIGIGAGGKVDGQVLVMHDILGLSASVPPFAQTYIDLSAASLRAFRKYGRDVREKYFPEKK